KVEGRVSSDEDLKLTELLRYYMLNIEAAKDLLYRRTKALIDYENSNKALDKARLKSKDVKLAENHQQECCQKFEQLSESAKEELVNFKRKRVAAFRKNLIEMSELEIKHARSLPFWSRFHPLHTGVGQSTWPGPRPSSLERDLLLVLNASLYKPFSVVALVASDIAGLTDVSPYRDLAFYLFPATLLLSKDTEHPPLFLVLNLQLEYVHCYPLVAEWYICFIVCISVHSWCTSKGFLEERNL
ncbi:hypothetical protein STEG23_031158, partial [Scotinomys teguina]